MNKPKKVSVSKGIVHESFEEEVVIIHLQTGKYYSLRQSGAFIWKSILADSDILSILNKLTGSYKVESDILEKDLYHLIGQLLDEGLLDESTDEAGPDRKDLHLVEVKEPADYQSPVLEVFTDMQDLILLDPIHDVNPEGWPYQDTGN